MGRLQFNLIWAIGGPVQKNGNGYWRKIEKGRKEVHVYQESSVASASVSFNFGCLILNLVG